MGLLLVTGLAALIPSLLLVWFFRSRDAHPEPAGAIWGTFFLGVLSIVPTLFVALPAALFVASLKLSPWAHGLADAFLSAALPEEALKLAVLWFYAARHRAFDEPMDGVVYGVMASLGFATLENVLYVAQGGLGLAAIRALTAVPMHACCGALMGYHVGRVKFPRGPSGGSSLLAAYALPVLFHGLYDAPLLALKALGEPGGGAAAALTKEQAGLLVLQAGGAALLVLGLLFVWTKVLVGRARRDQREAMSSGTLVLLAPVDSTPASSGGCLAWLLMLGGGALASFTLFIAWVVFVASAEARGKQAQDLLLGGVCIGAPPLLVGLLMFVLGLRRLPRPTPRRSSYA